MSTTINYKPNVEGYNQLSEDNLYLLEISRTIVMNYIFPKKDKDIEDLKETIVNKHVELKELIDFCGIKLKSNKIKDQEAYTKIFNKFVKDIDSITYDEQFGIMDEVVMVANVCLNTRKIVAKYRAKKSKKLLFS